MPDDNAGHIEDAPLADALSERYLAYALSTIMSRSLPDVRDGLKPVHRRLIYGMHVLRLDESTLPPTVRAYASRAFDNERSTERLVHGVFDAYTLQDINFAVRPAQ